MLLPPHRKKCNRNTIPFPQTRTAWFLFLVIQNLRIPNQYIYREPLYHKWKALKHNGLIHAQFCTHIKWWTTRHSIEIIWLLESPINYCGHVCIGSSLRLTLSAQLYGTTSKPQQTSRRISNVQWCACRIQIGDYVISSSKTAVTFIPYLGNIPQDHDPMFTVASMFKQMQARPLCIIPNVYPWPGWKWYREVFHVPTPTVGHCKYWLLTIHYKNRWVVVTRLWSP